MKKKIYPQYRTITVEFTNGLKFNTRSTHLNNHLKLDIDPSSHPAWSKKEIYSINNTSSVFKFNKRFSGLKLNNPFNSLL